MLLQFFYSFKKCRHNSTPYWRYLIFFVISNTWFLGDISTLLYCYNIQVWVVRRVDIDIKTKLDSYTLIYVHMILYISMVLLVCYTSDDVFFIFYQIQSLFSRSLVGWLKRGMTHYIISLVLQNNWYGSVCPTMYCFTNIISGGSFCRMPIKY